MAFQDELRGYVDSTNAKYGINWKEAEALAGQADGRAALTNWLYSKSGMDRGEAAKYAEAIYAMKDPRAEGSRQHLENTFGQFAPQNTPAAAPQQDDALMARIRAFTDELARAPGMDDPVFAGLIGAGRAAASQSIGQTGIRGGLADLATTQMAQKSVLPYLQQRQGLRMQGESLLNQRDMGLDDRARGWATLDMQGQQLRAGEAERMWAQQQNQGQSIGSAIGGGLGLAGGVIGAIATGGALAPAIPALAAGGSAIGGGIGGQSATPYKPYNYAVNRGGRSAFSGGSY